MLSVVTEYIGTNDIIRADNIAYVSDENVTFTKVSAIKTTNTSMIKETECAMEYFSIARALSGTLQGSEQDTSNTVTISGTLYYTIYERDGLSFAGMNRLEGSHRTSGMAGTALSYKQVYMVQNGDPLNENLNVIQNQKRTYNFPTHNTAFVAYTTSTWEPVGIHGSFGTVACDYIMELTRTSSGYSWEVRLQLPVYVA